MPLHRPLPVAETLLGPVLLLVGWHRPVPPQIRFFGKPLRKSIFEEFEAQMTPESDFPEIGEPMHEVQHISMPIASRPEEVYAFAANPGNLPRWASGLARSEVQKDGEGWIVDSPLGKLKIKFAPRNELGVLDHEVTLESGQTFHNPMRVIPNGEGSECIFTLIRQAPTSDEEFAKDKATIERDLKTLKDLLENKQDRKSRGS